LPQELWSGAAQHEESSGPSRAVRQDAQSAKYFRFTLNLVKYDESPQWSELEHRIFKAREIPVVFKVKASDRDGASRRSAC
jgi:hypothetical protein